MNRISHWALVSAILIGGASSARAELLEACIEEYVQSGLPTEIAEKWCFADSSIVIRDAMQSKANSSAPIEAKASALAPYKFTNLNTLSTNPLPTTAFPYGLDSYENIVGVINEPGVTAQAFIQFKDPARLEKFQVVIGTGLPTTAVSMNDEGAVVGYYKPPAGLDRGFIRPANSTITENFIHPDATYARGGLTRSKDINNLGEVVGYSIRTDTGSLYSWRKIGTTFTMIKNGTFDTTVEGINDKGLIIGHYTSGSLTVGFIIHNSAYVTIQPPGSAGGSVRPLDINNSNQIIGTFTNTAGNTVTFVAEYQEKDKKFTYIIVDGSATVSSPYILNGINDAGFTVGQATSPTSRSVVGPTCGFPNQFKPELPMPALSPLALPKDEVVANKSFDIRNTQDEILAKSGDFVISELRKKLSKQSLGPVTIEFGSEQIPNYIYQEQGLTRPHSGSPIEIAKQFLKDNAKIFHSSESNIDKIKKENFKLSKFGNDWIVDVKQNANGLPIFQSTASIFIRANGSVQSLSGSIAPDQISATEPTISAKEALKKTIAYVADDLNPNLRLVSKSEKIDKETIFELPSYNQTDAMHGSALIYFPLNGSLRLAWETMFHKSQAERYLVIVDATTSEVLYATNLVQNAAPEGKVFAFDPSRGALVKRPFQIGWFDGASLGGNNACVRENLDGAMRIRPPSPTPTPPAVLNRRAGYRPIRDNLLFNFNFNNTFNGKGDPLPDLNVATTNAFYWVNLMHDYFKSIGFNEEKFNFQADNLGQPGKGADEVHILVNHGWLQDPGPFTRNNAFFYPTPDGYSPRTGKPTLSLLLFDTPTHRADSSFAADMLIHEYAHGVSTRIVSKGSNTFLDNAIQSRALGEGWSDFFALNYLDTPVFGSYVGDNPAQGLRDSNVNTSTRTFAKICESAATSDACLERLVYQASMVWSSALWQTRRYLIPANATPAEALEIKTRIATVVLKGMENLPAKPTMTKARTSVIAAASSLYGATYKAAFEKALACRGLGTSANSQNANTLVPKEAFNFPGGECLPNLEINMPLGTVPATVKRGTSFTLANATANQGDAPSKAATTRFFLSTNGTNRVVTLGGTRSINELAPFGGAQASVNSVLSVPATTAPRKYFVLACPNVCPAGETGCTVIKESNVQNCRAAATQITVTQ